MSGQKTDQLAQVVTALLPTLGFPVNRKWEHHISTDLDLALRIHCSSADWYRLARKTFAVRSPLGFADCILLRRQQVRFGKRRAKRMGLDADGTNLGHIARKFKLAMNGVFFHGDQPGHVDLSFYGTIAGYLFANCDIGKFILRSAELYHWQSLMSAKVPLNSLFPESRPIGF